MERSPDSYRDMMVMIFTDFILMNHHNQCHQRSISCGEASCRNYTILLYQVRLFCEGLNHIDFKLSNMKLISHHLPLQVVTLFTLFWSCSNQTKTDPSETKLPATTPQPPAKELVFDKLVGTWKNEDGKNFERWVKNPGGTYQSVAFSLKGSDTSWNEQANIFQENEKWVFENTVKGQNNGKSVRFISSSLSENSVQFSNPAHDFPTDVNYTVTGPNTLNAFIVGPNNKSGKDTIPFNYTRLN